MDALGSDAGGEGGNGCGDLVRLDHRWRWWKKISKLTRYPIRPHKVQTEAMANDSGSEGVASYCVRS